MKKIVIFPLVGIFCLNLIHIDTSVKYNQLKNLKSVSIIDVNAAGELMLSPNFTPTVLVTSVVFATVLSASICLTMGGDPPKPEPPKPEDPKDPRKTDPKKLEFNERHSFINEDLYLFNLG